jgi:hypothetical protein
MMANMISICPARRRFDICLVEERIMGPPANG